MKILLIAFLFLLFSVAVNAQVADDCAAKLQTSQARLEKTLDALDKSETEKHAVEEKSAALEKALQLSEALTAAKDTLLASKDAELAIFRNMKCSKTSFLFGIISVKKCL